jgi:hypothetical protein
MRITLLMATAAALAACSDDSVTPSVTITNATPETLVPDDDSLDDLTITVRYDDGDGDLGEGVAEVHDCRAAGLVTELPIPAIAPTTGVHITGTLELHVNDVGAVTSAALPETCEELGVAELGPNEAVFCVILVDVAGNRSTGDCTLPILVE